MKVTRNMSLPGETVPEHDVIKQSDFARIEIASQREANTVIFQSLRGLVQKCDLDRPGFAGGSNS